MKDNKGRFVKTTGSTRYKRIERNGKNLQLHRYLWEQYHNREIPEGFIIHHIDNNRDNNKIENLDLMSYAEHNYLHGKGRKPWNYGVKCPNISESKMGHIVTEEQIQKQKETWKNKYIESMKLIDDLFKKGLDFKEIGGKLGLSYRTVHWRYKKYIEDYEGECWNERNTRRNK